MPEASRLSRPNVANRHRKELVTTVLVKREGAVLNPGYAGVVRRDAVVAQSVGLRNRRNVTLDWLIAIEDYPDTVFNHME